LVQKIKDAIVELISSEGISVKASIYISEKLNHSYGYLSNLFSEITHTSIENFLIIRKIEFAKELIISKKLSFTEIAYRLNYSSVAHLSTQFKNTTGMTPSQFQKIISLRRKSSYQRTISEGCMTKDYLNIILVEEDEGKRIFLKIYFRTQK
jgi:AraC-like DNA-binding protein